MLIDTHAHLYSEKLIVQIDEVMARASASDISHVVLPNIDLESIEPMLEVNERHPNCFPAMGLHPCSVDLGYERVLAQMEVELESGKYVAIGETGIDLYWDKTYFKEQTEAFDRQLVWAAETGLPIIIHSRDSLDECIEQVKRRQTGQLTGVFHCFTGTEEHAAKIRDLGFYIGIGGVVTYKNSELPGVLKQNGADNIVLETDSPYLPPVPHRGKANEPAFIPFVLDKLCEIFETDQSHLSALTTANAQKLFRKASFI